EEDKPQYEASLSVSVNQVRVDVAVRDKKDNLITGLRKEHFTLYEDKVEQEIVNFSPIEAPMTAVLLIEYNKAISWDMLYEAWLSSQYFVRGMRRGDWVAVVAFDIRPEILVDFTQDKAEVFNSLRALNFPAFSESNFYDALYDVLDRTQETEGKTAVIAVASGIDTFSKKNLSQLLKRVKKSNATIFAVSLGGHQRARYGHNLPATVRMTLLQADNTLKTITKWTGGEAYFPRFVSQYRGIFETISAMLRHQYSLSYIPTNTKKDGKFRKIRVKVNVDVNGDGKPDKLKLFHRNGYEADKG
ncbi:MAG: VWA domain-containing protein, partial [Acidobacteriota bacterium]